jgi:hypothetical protein
MSWPRRPGIIWRLYGAYRNGQNSIRIKSSMANLFVWREGHAYEVEIVDYH